MRVVFGRPFSGPCFHPVNAGRGRGLIQQRFQQGYNMRGNQGGQQGHNN